MTFPIVALVFVTYSLLNAMSSVMSFPSIYASSSSDDSSPGSSAPSFNSVANGGYSPAAAGLPTVNWADGTGSSSSPRILVGESNRVVTSTQQELAASPNSRMLKNAYERTGAGLPTSALVSDAE
jgi:hypothetical protein